MSSLKCRKRKKSRSNNRQRANMMEWCGRWHLFGQCSTWMSQQQSKMTLKRLTMRTKNLNNKCFFVCCWQHNLHLKARVWLHVHCGKYHVLTTYNSFNNFPPCPPLMEPISAPCQWTGTRLRSSLEQRTCYEDFQEMLWHFFPSIVIGNRGPVLISA